MVLLRWLMNLAITSMIFFPDKTFYEMPADYGLEAEDVELTTEDDVKLHGWFIPAPHEKSVLLFFHGNAGNISNRLYKIKGWVERGFSVFLLDYRGYGKSEGQIRSEKDVLRDAETAFAWLRGVRNVPLDKIILYGESLGSHPAIWLASQYHIGAVILEAPFTSFIDLAVVHYPMVPKFMLKDFAFVNIDLISKAKAPVFILHGTQDEICPYSMAGELFEIAPKPKEFFTIADGNHNDLPIKAGDDFWEKPAEFLNRLLGV